MTIKRVFKNTMPGTQYLFANGKSAQFVDGRYETDVATEILELDLEIQNGIPHIYVDPADSTIDTGMIDYIREAQIAAVKRATIEYTVAKEAQDQSDAVKLMAPISPQASVFDTAPVTGVSGASPEAAQTVTAGIASSSMSQLLARKTTANAGIATTASAPDSAVQSS